MGMTDEEMLAETRGFNEGLERLLATLPPVFTVAARRDPAQPARGR